MRDVLTALRERSAVPDDVFCIFAAGGREITVTSCELLAQSSRFANALVAMGLGPQAPVAIVLKHTPDMYAAFLGAMLAGCTPSFMPYLTPKQDADVYWTQHEILFGRIGVAAIISYAENVAILAQRCPGVPVVTPEDVAREADTIEPRSVRPEDVAFLQHSSGTTSLKKGVLLSHGAVARQLETYAAALGLSQSDRIVSWLPLYHDMGLIACFMLPLWAGVPVVSLDPFEWVSQPAMLFDALARHGGTHVWQPNFAFHHLCRTTAADWRGDLSGVKAFIDCSEPCYAETFDLFAKTFAHLGVRRDQCQVCYAMAETVFAVTQTAPGTQAGGVDVDADALQEGFVRRPERAARRVLSCGRPVEGVELRIADPTAQGLPEGRVGEVAVRAPFLFSGYHRDDERTAERFRDGWYFTRDLGFLRGGELYVLGRTDDLIILNGRNVVAHQLEYAINAQIPEIKGGRCIALGAPSPETGSRDLVVLAEVEDAGAEKKVARAVRSVVMNELGFLPSRVKIVPAGWLMKTTSGKLSREMNLSKYLAEEARAKEAIAE